MAGSQRIYRQRIAATAALQKIFRAMELIAASRIGKAREAARKSRPYTHALGMAVSAVAAHAEDVDHPLTREGTGVTRAAILVFTGDRGMAGAYNTNALRAADQLEAQLREVGGEVVLYVLGARGVSHYEYVGRAIEQSWVGISDAPSRQVADEIADTLMARFMTPVEQGGVDELHVVFTQFRSMITQEPRVLRMLPLHVVEEEGAGEPEMLPLYEFEPDPESVLDAMLQRYVRARIYDCMLQAAASELSARQSAMHTATQNAEDLIRDYTRLANAARQGEITQEITEIVSGSDALGAGAA